ncbi:hypothetical protein PIB30_089799 [Stylosanthes scabra]|uniref:Uncharacterized protein n=1 Tax=Stylosanthes scabra TaxID=79078 RepID=A0ABU6VTX2_9FABA|nr:hypothetical protein [Stylosanthes scabra]
MGVNLVGLEQMSAISAAEPNIWREIDGIRTSRDPLGTNIWEEFLPGRLLRPLNQELKLHVSSNFKVFVHQTQSVDPNFSEMLKCIGRTSRRELGQVTNATVLA